MQDLSISTHSPCALHCAPPRKTSSIASSLSVYKNATLSLSAYSPKYFSMPAHNVAPYSQTSIRSMPKTPQNTTKTSEMPLTPPCIISHQVSATPRQSRKMQTCSSTHSPSLYTKHASPNILNVLHDNKLYNMFKSSLSDKMLHITPLHKMSRSTL